MVNGDVENMAVALRLCYCRRKAQQLGRAYSPHPRFKSSQLWLTAATLCTELEADPEAFVEAAFRYNTVPGGPFPQQIGSKAAVRWYKRHVENSKIAVAVPGQEDKVISPIEQEHTMNMSHVALLALERGVKETIMDRSLWHIPDYTRVLLMPKDPEVLQRFGRSAAGQINNSPALRKLLKEKGYDLSFMEAFS